MSLPAVALESLNWGPPSFGMDDAPNFGGQPPHCEREQRSACQPSLSSGVTGGLHLRANATVDNLRTQSRAEVGGRQEARTPDLRVANSRPKSGKSDSEETTRPSKKAEIGRMQERVFTRGSAKSRTHVGHKLATTESPSVADAWIPLVRQSSRHVEWRSDATPRVPSREPDLLVGGNVVDVIAGAVQQQPPSPGDR